MFLANGLLTYNILTEPNLSGSGIWFMLRVCKMLFSPCRYKTKTCSKMLWTKLLLNTDASCFKLEKSYTEIQVTRTAQTAAEGPYLVVLMVTEHSHTSCWGANNDSLLIQKLKTLISMLWVDISTKMILFNSEYSDASVGAVKKKPTNRRWLILPFFITSFF